MNSLQTLPRLLAHRIAAALRTAPVVVVTGARQTGKTTLARSLGRAPKRFYLTLDDVEVRGDAESAPHDLLGRAPRLTLDEVQHVPALLSAIKRDVDRRRTAGRFLLTGSANLLLMRRVSESLAGRAVYFTLGPMTRRERLGSASAGIWSDLFDTPVARWRERVEGEVAEPADWRAEARRGGFPTPALHLRGSTARDDWFAGYAATYLERDVLQLSAIQALPEFRRLMRAVCLRIGGLLNQTELGRDIGLPQPTVHRYLAMLETSYQLIRLPAYSVNRTKRLIKAPKAYWSDVGLALHLSGETTPRGAHLENLLLADLHAWAAAAPDRPEILYWRTAAGEEVDFVIEWRGRLLPIEMKAARRVSSRDARGIAGFREEYGSAVLGGLVLYAGDETMFVADKVLAAPWWKVV